MYLNLIFFCFSLTSWVAITLKVPIFSFRLSSRTIPGRTSSLFGSIADEKNPNVLKQLQIKFCCDEIDSDDLSEFLFELGTLSVSVEVESEKLNVLNDEKNWADLGKQKSWQTAMLRANFPRSFDENTLKSIVIETFPDVNFEFNTVGVEDIDWVSHVQESWEPQVSPISVITVNLLIFIL